MAAGGPESARHIYRYYRADLRALRGHALTVPAPARKHHLHVHSGPVHSMAIPLPNETRVRPYTLASNPGDDGPLEIVFNLVGWRGFRISIRARGRRPAQLHRPFRGLYAGSCARVRNDFRCRGHGHRADPPMLRRALAKPTATPLKLFHAARTRSELLYAEEFEAAASRCGNFAFEPILAQPPPAWSGRCGQLSEHIEGLFVNGDQRRDRAFYLCGVGKPIIDLRDLLRKSGLRAARSPVRTVE